MKNFIYLLFLITLVVSSVFLIYLFRVKLSSPKQKALLKKHKGNDPGHTFYRYLYSAQGLNDYLLFCGAFVLGSFGQIIKPLSAVVGTILLAVSFVALLVSAHMIAKHRPKLAVVAKPRKRQPKSTDWSNLS